MRYLAVNNLTPAPLGYVGWIGRLRRHPAVAGITATFAPAFPNRAGRPLVIMHTLDGALAATSGARRLPSVAAAIALMRWYIRDLRFPAAGNRPLAQHRAHQAVAPYSVSGYVDYLEANQPASRYFEPISPGWPPSDRSTTQPGSCSRV